MSYVCNRHCAPSTSRSQHMASCLSARRTRYSRTLLGVALPPLVFLVFELFLFFSLKPYVSFPPQCILSTSLDLTLLGSHVALSYFLRTLRLPSEFSFGAQSSHPFLKSLLMAGRTPPGFRRLVVIFSWRASFVNVTGRCWSLSQPGTSLACFACSASLRFVSSSRQHAPPST